MVGKFEILNSKKLIPILPRLGLVDSIFTGRFLREEYDVLVEGIYKTYPIDFVIRHLCKYLRFSDNWDEFRNDIETYCGFVTKVLNDNHEYTLQMVVPSDQFSKAALERVMRLCGYYESAREALNDFYDQVVFEKMHQENKINKMVMNKGSIYHITKAIYKDKILKCGLEPRHKDKKSMHPDRVYFFLDDVGERGFRNIVKELYSKEFVGDLNTFKYERFVVFKVNTNDLDVDFFYDPNMLHAVYTKENVKPSFLTVAYEF